MLNRPTFGGHITLAFRFKLGYQDSNLSRQNQNL